MIVQGHGVENLRQTPPPLKSQKPAAQSLKSLKVNTTIYKTYGQVRA